MLTVPPPAAGLHVVDMNDTSISLAWEAHDATLPAEYVSYLIQYTDDNWQSVQEVGGITENQHIISELDPSKSYMFQVANVLFDILPPLRQIGNFTSSINSKNCHVSDA